jgi:MoaA/NifB/PqqE/SkfB family radical SAM enzyme
VASISPTGIAPVLQVHPTRRCNLSCAHCYTSSGPSAREELTLKILGACLEDAVKLGYRQLALSGGEPLLYGSLRGLLAYARELGMVTTLTTNAMLATPSRWEALAALVDVAAVSIDGTSGEHDAIRCKDGAFAKTVANLDVIRSSGVPFGLIFTLTQHNVNSLEYVVRLAAEHGARSVQVHPLTLYGRASVALPDARPDSMELVAALCEASRLGTEVGVAVHVDALSREQLLAYRDHLVPRRPVARLADVAPVLIVQANAGVVPLTHDVSSRNCLGSLRDAGLASLAHDWLASGEGDRLADACERTWTDLVAAESAAAVYWYDEVASRTRALERCNRNGTTVAAFPVDVEANLSHHSATRSSSDGLQNTICNRG